MEFENKIFNEDCRQTMDELHRRCVDVVLTSPFYNTNAKAKGGRTVADDIRTGSLRMALYDQFVDCMSNDEYRNFTVGVFNGFDKILKQNGVVLYNVSYGNENSECLFLSISDIITKTNFTIADVIIWKKKSALPANLSPNKLTRITEFVFVFCRKSEYMTFHMNKRQTSTRDTGQKMYETIFNFIEAANNDGANNLNKATYSTELCERLLSIYAPPGGTVYDSFMGTGTTAVAAKRLGLKYVGSEISEKQCAFARKRLQGTRYEPSLF